MEGKRLGRPARGIATTAIVLRCPTTLLQRIQAYQGQVEAQAGVRVARHDVLLRLLTQALDALVAPDHHTAIAPVPSVPTLPPAKRRSHAMPQQKLARIAAERRAHPDMPLRQFADHLYTKRIYRAHGKYGNEQPAAIGFLHKWLKEAAGQGLLSEA